jgi:hypothetical protein
MRNVSLVLPAPAAVTEWRDATPDTSREQILTSQVPVVLRGAVAHWPVVRAGRESPQALRDYLRAFDSGTPVDTMYGDPAIRGRFFYNDDLSGLNFENRKQRLSESLEQLIAHIETPAPPALYVGALPMDVALPGMARDNALALLDPRIMPRLWLSNRVTVQTHYDLSMNIACVIAGRRRFTLFPPEQLVNLYVGPLEFTLAGQPISMVRLDEPDLARFPKFGEAWRHAQVAELGPGDALFIPYMWWHHVESLEPFNALVNYWWDDTPPWLGSPFEALVHAVMSVHSLPAHRREIWRQVFEHHVFQQDAAAHLDPRRRGIQGEMDLRLASGVRAWLIRALTPRTR